MTDISEAEHQLVSLLDMNMDRHHGEPLVGAVRTLEIWNELFICF